MVGCTIEGVETVLHPTAAWIAGGADDAACMKVFS